MEDVVVGLGESLLATHMSMVIGPSSDDRVEFLDHLFLFCASHVCNRAANFLHKGCVVLLGWRDDQLALVFAYILSQEVEPVFDVCCDCLFF